MKHNEKSHLRSTSNFIFTRNMVFVFLAVGALLLTSCGSNEKVACDGRDWYELGRQDGLVGRVQNHDPIERRPACEQSEVISDVQRYRSGHSAGLVVFCTEVSGFELALAGEKYNKVCPQVTEESFLKGYRLGQRAKKLNDDNRQLESQIVSTQAELREKLRSNESVDSLQRRLEELQVLRVQKEKQIDSLRRSL